MEAPADAETRTAIAVDMPAHFESIRTELFDTTQAVMVQFDSARGFPVYIQIDNRWMTDVGYIREVVHFRVIPEHQAQCAAM